MSKKPPKRKKTNKRKKPIKKTKPDSSKEMPPIPDRRAMERTLSDIGKILSSREFDSDDDINAFLNKMLSSGEIPGPSSGELSPLDQAQDIMYDAWEASGKKRVDLARKALEISEDCADAYVLLAEETARDAGAAKALYEKGVKAGERSLGEKVFQEDAGHFWGILETRPYMRARLGLAQCLWFLGERKQAIEHYQDMLRLNPGDNQGIRYILASCLLEEGLDDELEKLLEQYKDDAAATWAYNQALLAFRTDGESRKADKHLKEALDVNPFVPAYLLGDKMLPRSLPDYMGMGDESEAVVYAAESIRVWRKTKGALQWLATHTKSI